MGIPAPVASSFTHHPALLHECLSWLSLGPGALVVDGTVGGGGHAAAILEETAPDGRLVALDLDPEAQAFARLMISGATECPVDKQGRILVPPYLRKHASLEREVTVAGVGPKIELWDKGRFEASLTNTQARYPEMAQSVAAKLRM